VEQPASLAFRCTLGSGARVRYGNAFQECPSSGALLAIDLADSPGVIRVSVEADTATEWEISVGTNEGVEPLPSPESS
jgi:hypothetical protein